MHKCPRCGGVCECTEFNPDASSGFTYYSSCEHECDAWTGCEDSGRDEIEDTFAEFERGQDLNFATRARWRRREFTDAERVTLALFSAEHLEGEPWQDVLDQTAIEDLLEAAEPDGTSPESDGTSTNSDGMPADSEGWERDL